jgi:GT2 family glycosyltransferase
MAPEREQTAVVIPSWNSLDLLRPCLDSLRAQDSPFEPFVVDNGSVDGTVDFLRAEGVPHLALPANVGFARAMNLGVARTAAPAVLLLNADTVLEPGALRALRAALDRDPGLAGVQPRLLQGDGAGGAAEDARIYSAGMALLADGRAVEVGAGEPLQRSEPAAREIFGVCGASALLRREAFEALGGFDESYVSFYEDVDLNVRARIAGYRFAYVPEATVWHLGNASWQVGFERPNAENARLVARNRIATQAKFMPATALPRILAVESAALAKALRERRLGPTLRGKLEGLRRLPRSLRDRRRLAAEGDLGRARRWLGAG